QKQKPLSSRQKQKPLSTGQKQKPLSSRQKQKPLSTGQRSESVKKRDTTGEKKSFILKNSLAVDKELLVGPDH
ncbi:hypothetical protein BJ508DRAFT_331904, partial [Ascobolus immersus RN42]